VKHIVRQKRLKRAPEEGTRLRRVRSHRRVDGEEHNDIGY